MPGRRSRVVQSQSFGDIGLLNHRPSPELRWDAEFSSSLVDQSCQNILMVSTATLADGKGSSGQAPVEHFLERCYRCKKRLHQKQDVYMYGYLRSFCTPACRDAQIEIDMAAQQVNGQTIGATTSSSK